MALAMAVASLGLAAGPQPKSTAAPAIAGAVPVNRPDVPGGYESSFVLIRIKPDAQVVKRSDGLWTIQRRELAPDSPDLDASAIAAALQRHRVLAVKPVFTGVHVNPRMAADLGLDRYFKVQMPRGSDAPAIARELRGFTARIEHAQADNIGGIAVVPNDTYFNQQWDMLNTGQNGGTPNADCHATQAWDLHQGTSQVMLAIIDTGVQHLDPNIAGTVDHPELFGRVVSGWNTRDDTDNTNDEHGHGTHCAGIAGAAGNNAQGVAGMNWNMKILAMRVTDAVGNANQTDVAEAVVYAVDHGANVLSMSLQFYGGVNTALQDAVAYAYGSNVLPVAATGNYQAPGIIAWPAKYPKCMGVGATERFDGHAGFSNNGPEIDLSAPGAEIFGLWRDSQYTTGFPSVGVQSGTSMATPHVGGLACLMKSYNPLLTAAQLEHILKITCDDKGTAGWDPLFGWGRINAYAALRAATKPADVNRDGVVNIDDLLAMIAAWGTCPASSLCPADITANGVVDIDDLLQVLLNWG